MRANYFLKTIYSYAEKGSTYVYGALILDRGTNQYESATKQSRFFAFVHLSPSNVTWKTTSADLSGVCGIALILTKL